MYEYDESYRGRMNGICRFVRSAEFAPRTRGAVQLFIHLPPLISPFHSTLSNKHARRQHAAYSATSRSQNGSTNLNPLEKCVAHLDLGIA